MSAPTLFNAGWSASEAAEAFAAGLPLIGSTFGDDTPRVRRNDPLESHKAADSNNVRDSRAVVLAAFHERHHFADHELVEYLKSTGYTPSRIRTARHELSADEILELAGTTKTQTGRDARVWALRKDAA